MSKEKKYYKATRTFIDTSNGLAISLNDLIHTNCPEWVKRHNDMLENIAEPEAGLPVLKVYQSVEDTNEVTGASATDTAAQQAAGAEAQRNRVQARNSKAAAMKGKETPAADSTETADNAGKQDE